MGRTKKTSDTVFYYDINKGMPIVVPSATKRILSRIALPLLALLSREKTLDLHLTPLDDERVIMALRHARGRALDIGCGANNFIRSYGNGIGVDVFPWDGCDKVIEDAAKLPFKKAEFETITYLACLNHIPNRQESVNKAFEILPQNGRVLVTMITPRWGRFIHWIRFKNDPDHKDRHIDHDHELLGMSAAHVSDILLNAGFKSVKRKRFVFGLNSLYIAEK